MSAGADLYVGASGPVRRAEVLRDHSRLALLVVARTAPAKAPVTRARPCANPLDIGNTIPRLSCELCSLKAVAGLVIREL